MAERRSSSEEKFITFLRNRDYVLQKYLGNGACGETVLLRDDIIDELFVCKKYTPYSETQRKELFANFVREIKLLHKLQHEAVVRVFNYFLYPESHTGYIVMEYVDGLDVETYISRHPENINSVFVQAVSGFAHLESRMVLHRDIRPQNVLVRTDGAVKIIDLGFGKQVSTSEDFGKSISLNWWCDTPNDFLQQRYDFSTEVYFVGKLFEKLLTDNGISDFKFRKTLEKMRRQDPGQRIGSFAEVEKEIGNDQFLELDFSSQELEAYREFADNVCGAISKVQSGIRYFDDISKILRQLSEAYHRCMLEEWVHDSTSIIKCFIEGTYYYNRRYSISVDNVRKFVRLLESASEEKRRVILANLHVRFDAIDRFSPPLIPDDEIPF